MQMSSPIRFLVGTFLFYSIAYVYGCSFNFTSEITSVEPFKGLVWWTAQAQSKDAQYGDAISLEYVYLLPNEVVTSKNPDNTINYDFSSFNTIINAVESRGHTAIVRIRYTQPGDSTNNVPAYIKSTPGYTSTSHTTDDGIVEYPDWSNTELQWFAKQFIKDVAALYDQDTRVAFLQVGFGHWAEYHIYGTTLNLGVNFPDKVYQGEYLTLAVDSFPNTPVSISIDAAASEYTSYASNDTLRALGFGLFDDSFMHSKHDIGQGADSGYNEESYNTLKHLGDDTAAERWTASGVFGGEISYYTANDQKNFLDPAGLYGVTWAEAVAKYHVTYMLANDVTAGSFGTPAYLKAAGLAAGYSLEILSILSTPSGVDVQVRNNGVAPPYHDMYVAVSGDASTQSLKGLQPGDTITVSVASAAPVTQDSLEVSITSPKLASGTTVPFLCDCKNRPNGTAVPAAAAGFLGTLAAVAALI
jgi:hypothetical protein